MEMKAPLKEETFNLYVRPLGARLNNETSSTKVDSQINLKCKYIVPGCYRLGQASVRKHSFLLFFFIPQ